MLINDLRKDCENWANNLSNVIRNEREMQVLLAMHLKMSGNHYDYVHVEYPVPYQMLYDETQEKIPWQNDIYVDIVVEKDGDFAIVELKYATKAISNQPRVFYQPVPHNINIIKNQDASNLTMYNYWKDVRRIEVISGMPKVVGGVALILTNNKLYWNGPKQNPAPAYSNFSTEDGRTVKGKMKWRKKNNGNEVSEEITNGHPDFEIIGSYKCNWEDTKILGGDVTKKSPNWFRYMITEVIPSKKRTNKNDD